jgi:hypothetical protein
VSSFNVLACNETFTLPITDNSQEIIVYCDLKQQPLNVIFPKDAIKISLPATLKAKKSEWSLRDLLYLFTAVVAFSGLIYSIRSHKIARLNRLEDQFLNEIDNFWFKEVITPKVLNPIFDFIRSQHLSFKNMSPLSDDENHSQEALIEGNIENLTDATTELQLSLNLLKNIPYGENYCISIKEAVDGLEDHLSRYLFSVGESLFDPDDDESDIPDFDSIQDIFSFTQGQVLEFTKRYRNETKLQMKSYALNNPKDNRN